MRIPVNAEWLATMAEAAELHQRERAISLESVRLVGMLDRENVALKIGLSIEAFAKKIGLTPSMYHKRAQAARVIRTYPEAEAMVRAGETEISQVAALAAKITPANAKLLLTGIRNKSKREVELLLSVVTADGRILEREPEVEVRAVLTKSELAMLDRAREVLSHGGKVPTNAEVLVKALDDLLTRRDPLRKAERAMQRKEARSPAGRDVSTTTRPEHVSANGLATENHSAPGHKRTESKETGRSSRPKRTATPAAVRHATALRDQGQCRESLADGTRCPERFNLERDHRVPVCRGGANTVDNEVWICRRHNRLRAEREIGAKYLVSWEESRKRAATGRQPDQSPA
jgi:hypothetical protein